MTGKTCRICKSELPLSDFHRDKAKADGYRATCKPCFRQGLNKRPEKIEGMKRCSRCHTYKPLTAEHFAPYPDGRFFNYCRPCYRENKKQW